MKNAEDDIANIAQHSRLTNLVVSSSSRPLSSTFQPGPHDVICSRGKQAMSHEGNKSFRRMISTNLDAYSKAKNKMQKSIIVSAIIDKVRGDSPNGGFVRLEKGQWVEVGDLVAREKVGQTMRDMLHTKYKSSSQSKRQRRKEIQAKQNNDMDDFMKNNCFDITDRVRQLSLSATTEDELQAAFNQANCEFLECLKRNQKASLPESFSSLKKRSHPEDFTPLPIDSSHSSPMSLDEAVNQLGYHKL